MKYSLLNKRIHPDLVQIPRHSQSKSDQVFERSQSQSPIPRILLSTTITTVVPQLSMATVHLPTELWIAILHYLRPSSLRAVHCVSSALRDISSRFLFEDVHLELQETLQGASLKRFSERMAFLSSPGIALHARRVQLLTGENFGETPVSSDCRNKSIVVALRAIPFFVNLKSLHIYFWSKDTHADLSRLGLETLENLDELAITGCSFHSRNNPAAKIRVNRLSLRFCNFTHHSKGLPGLRRSFLPIIDPQALRLLTLHFDSGIFADWLEDDASPPTAFPNLRELRLTGSVSRAQLDKIFARFPSIRRFSIDSLKDTATPPRCCSELTLDVGDLYGGDNLAHHLAAAGRAPSVTSLNLTLSSARLGAWEAPYDTFSLIPNIAELRLIIWFEHMNSYRDTVTRETYPDILARVLRAPPELQHVIIEGSETLPFTVSECELEDALRSAIPNLIGIRFTSLAPEGRGL
ncbi:hypothetical protein C8F04DRAFT_1113920, partial [Mycena alexandri]